FGKIREQPKLHRQKRRKGRFVELGPPSDLRLRGRNEWILLLFEHDFRGLDHSRNSVTQLKIHFLGATSGDYTLDIIVANLYDHVGHDSTELEFCNFSFKPVPR